MRVECIVQQANSKMGSLENSEVSQQYITWRSTKLTILLINCVILECRIHKYLFMKMMLYPE